MLLQKVMLINNTACFGGREKSVIFFLCVCLAFSVKISFRYPASAVVSVLSEILIRHYFRVCFEGCTTLFNHSVTSQRAVCTPRYVWV